MSLSIAGMGWVTPLGLGLNEVWERLLNGEQASAEVISDPVDDRPYPVFRVPADALKDLPPHPRLRRASAISRFAAAAGLSALQDGSLKIDENNAARVALIFAISNGGVIYTKRFYHDIVASGAGAASPLLFPETVFNAPASHLAAILGITGVSYTLVGDGAVGLLALRLADDLMMNGELDYCLVVGAEEADWLLCDAYARWRLLKSAPPIELYAHPPRGMVVSEGAGAVLLGREGSLKINETHPGGNYANRRQTSSTLEKIMRELHPAPDSVVIGSANGTFIDDAEARAVAAVAPKALVYSPKPALGESVGASGLWQTIVGGMALRTRRIPPLSQAGSHISSNLPDPNTLKGVRDVVVLSCGLNQQVGGLRLSA